jgi:hypothetical protein
MTGCGRAQHLAALCVESSKAEELPLAQLLSIVSLLDIDSIEGLLGPFPSRQISLSASPSQE